MDECIKLGHVLELGVAVEQQRGVVSPRKARGVQLLQVTRQAGDALRIKEPAGPIQEISICLHGDDALQGTCRDR